MNGFKSYILFAGKSVILMIEILLAAAFACIAAARIVSACSGDVEIWDFLRFIGEVIWISCIFVVMCALFNANMKTAPGFKLFHSFPNAPSKFRLALLTADISLLIGTTIFTTAELLLFGDTSQMFVGLALFTLGWTNLFGNIGVWFRTIPFFVVGFMEGFLNGITDGEKFSYEIKLVMFAVCAVFCAVGILYSLINSKRIWEREK